MFHLRHITFLLLLLFTTILSAQVKTYHAIPYATASRWQQAVIAPGPDATADYSQPGPICPQPDFPSDNWGERGHNPQSEDCLVVTINTPFALDNMPENADLLPVLVHIHGGSFIYGGGEQCQNDLSELAQRGHIITVGITYRLGVLGFLYQDAVASANLGLHDQLLALEWVARYIHRFGGDKHRITLSGQSAGAQSVAYILATENHTPVQQAILFSAPLGVLQSRCTARAHANAYRNTLGKIDLSNASIDTLMGAQYRYQKAHKLQAMPFMPYDIDVQPKRLPTPPERVLVSVQKQDAALFVPKWLWNMGTDWVFLSPAKRYLKYMQSQGVDTTFILQDWAPRGAKYGATHAVELPLFTGTIQTWIGSFIIGDVTADELKPIRQEFQDKLIRYIKGGEF